MAFLTDSDFYFNHQCEQLLLSHIITRTYNYYFLYELVGADKESTKSGSRSCSSSSESEETTESEQNKTTMERKLVNMRRNIREVMSENQLDEETLAAQRQEMERLRRVQEQQRIIREVSLQL